MDEVSYTVYDNYVWTVCIDSYRQVVQTLLLCKTSDIEDEEPLVGERTHTDHSADAFHKDFLGCMLALFCVVPHYFQWFLTYTFHV